MTEENELVTPLARELERRWERMGRPNHSVDTTSYPQFTERLKFVSRVAFEQVAQKLHILPCPACIKEDVHSPSSGFECTRLLITMEKHPLQDTGNILNAVCHGCGFQQMWPHVTPTPRPLNSILDHEVLAKMQADQVGRVPPVARGLGPDLDT